MASLALTSGNTSKCTEAPPLTYVCVCVLVCECTVVSVPAHLLALPALCAAAYALLLIVSSPQFSVRVLIGRKTLNRYTQATLNNSL